MGWPRGTRRVAALLIASVIASGSPASAVTYTWSGGGSGTWSTDATNWTNATGSPWDGTSGPTNDAAFATAGDAAVLPGGVFANRILFSSPTSITGAGTITLTSGSLTVSDTTAATTVAAAFTGTGPLIKSGPGALVLSGSSTYTGTTALAAGTLRLAGGANRLPTTTAVWVTGSDTTLDLTASSQTLSAMKFPASTSGTVSTTISGAGGGLTVSGTGNFEVGPGGPGTGLINGRAAALSMANLASFTYLNTTGTVRVGTLASSSNTVASGTSVLLLAGTNTITASLLAVADVGANSDGGSAQLQLGQTNTLNVTTISQAGGRSNSAILFQTGLTNPSVVIRGTDGTTATGNWTVGTVSQGSTLSPQSFRATADFSAGTVDALVGTLTIGLANCSNTNRSGIQQSAFTMGSGTLAAGTINVARITSTSGSTTFGIGKAFAAYGALNIGTAGAVVSATNVYVAENTFSGTGSATATVSGTINLSAGTLRAATLARGAQTGNATVSVATTFNWTGGTIANLAGSNLTVDTLPLTVASGTGTFQADAGRTITVNATSPISGAGTLVKDGAGSLVLQAANTHTGAVRIAAGTLVLPAGGSLASSSITVGSGGVLDLTGQAGGYAVPAGQSVGGSGSVTGGLVVGSGAAVTPTAGSGALSVTGGITLVAGGNYQWQMLDATGTAGTGWGLISTDSVSFSGLSPSSPFNVDLWSLASANPAIGGDASNFNPTAAGSWRILTSASTITGFDPASFATTTLATGASSGFTNPTLGGTFSLALSSDSRGIDVRFTPYVPYTWYGSGSTAGGSGTWSTAGVTWNSGSSMAAWDSTKGALFGTTGGTVTLSSPQSVGYGMSFTADGYRLSGAALSLTGNQSANTVTVGGGLTATLATDVTATDGFTKSGVGTLLLAGSVAAAGGVSLQMGTLAVGAGGTTGTLVGDVATVAGTTLTFDRADGSTYEGVVSGAGGLRKAGAGTVTLAGANSYTGGTVLAGGTVELGSADALGTSGTIAFVGGALQFSAANTTDYSPRISSGTGQAFAVDTNGQTVTFATGLRGAGNTLTKLGDGTLVLSATGSFTGDTRIAAGTLSLQNTSALAGSTLDMNAADSGTFDLTYFFSATIALGGLKGSRGIDVAGSTLAVGSNGLSTTYDGTISGAGGVMKRGVGSLLLTATQTYTGLTAVSGGTLRLGVANQLPATGIVSLSGTGATLDIGATTQTLATITSGNGGVFTNMAITGSGGSLVLTGPDDLEIGPGGSVGSGQCAVVSLAGLTNFSYVSPSSTVRVGLKTGASQSSAPGVSALTLAQNTTIVAAALGLADINGTNDGGTGQLYLGQANVLDVGAITMSNARGDGLLQFAAGTSNPTATFRSTDGTSPIGTWLVGTVGQNSTSSARTSFTSTVDLSAGTADVAVTSLIIGQANCTSATRGGTQRSSFTMGSGTLSAETITVGRITSGVDPAGVGGAFSAYGTLAISKSGAVVNAGAVYVAENTFTGTGSATKTVSGTVALSAGTLLTGTLARGAQTGLANVVNTTFLWTGGTIGNPAGSDLTVDTLPLTLSSGTGTFLATSGQTITVNAASPISGGGSLTKAGAGTLLLQSSNGFTGVTRIAAGTLSVQDAAALAGSTLDLNAADSGTLAMSAETTTYTIGGLQGSRNLSLGSNSLSIGGNSQSTTYSGSLSGAGSVTKTGAGTTTLAGASTHTGSTTVQGGVLRLANGSALTASRLVVVAGGTGQVAPVTATSVASLDLATGNGLLDLTSGALTIAGGMTGPQFVAEILKGRADGTWSGTSGITSSTVAAQVADGTPRAVGWVDNGDGSLTAAYAAPGDTNIDWSIDILDASNFLALGKFDTGLPATWIEGDFSYDGIVDILDAADFFATGLYDSGNYNTASGATVGVAAVPEPSAIGVLGILAAGCLARALRRSPEAS